MSKFNGSQRPLVIEAAICPYRPAAPVWDLEAMIRESVACIDAGAGIVHHHHDMRFDAVASTEEMLALGKAVKAARPDALLYPDFLSGTTVQEYIGHIAPMAEAGALDLIPVDPGAGYSGQFDARGYPTGTNKTRFTFDDANETLAVARKYDVPLTIGVFEPFQLRWALAHAAAARMPKGSLVKLYLGGEYSLIKIGSPALNFGLPPTKAALDAYIDMLAGSGLEWMVGVIGDAILDTPVARYALERGGHIRVGIEDAAGRSEASNRETVEAVVALAQAVGRPVAQGDIARQAIGMPVLQGA